MLKQLIWIVSILMMILFTGCGSNSSSSSTGLEVTVVDGYIKDANVTDSVGNRATQVDETKGLYRFNTMTPTYPLYAYKNGIVVDTNSYFKLDMNTTSGTVISPISTLINGDETIKENLKQILGLSSDEELLGDYIENNNSNVAKLAQLCYAMLAVDDNKSSLTKFTTRLKNQDANTSLENNITQLLDKVISDDTNNSDVQDFLNDVKDYNGSVDNIETQIQSTKDQIDVADYTPPTTGSNGGSSGSTITLSADNINYTTTVSSLITLDWETLSNAKDSANGTLSASVKTQAKKGTAIVNGSKVSYSVNSNQSGSDSFVLEIASTNNLKKDITITIVNINTIAPAISQTTHTDGAIDIAPYSWIELQFNIDVDKTTLTSNTIKLDNNLTCSSITYDSSSKSARCYIYDLNDTTTALDENTTYTLTLTDGIKATNGIYKINSSTSTFTTGVINKLPIIKTGQTKCYDNSNNIVECTSNNALKDDGYYSNLDTYNYSRNFERNDTSNTVTDTRIDLVWDDSDDVNTSNQTWSTASTSCPTGFRLPTFTELSTLINYGDTSAPYRYGLDIGFKNTTGDDANINSLWVNTEKYQISFNTTTVVKIDSSLNPTSRFRCIKESDSQTTEFKDFNTTSGIKLDVTSGLMYKEDTTLRTWADAIQSCESSDLGDFEDWRLANIHELNNIVLNSTDTHWSSTTSPSDSTKALTSQKNTYISFDPQLKTQSFKSYCVRGAYKTPDPVSVTVVDGYIKDASVTDSNGNVATLTDASKGTYAFDTNKPSYPLYSTGGILVDTNVSFDINMSTSSGTVISPITTIVENDSDILNNLATTLSLSDSSKLYEDYINNNNLDIAKLAQLCYAMLRDTSTAKNAFITRLQNGSDSDIGSLIQSVIDNDTDDATIINFLNTIKSYSGTVSNLETTIAPEKSIIGGYDLNESKANLVQLIADYTSAYDDDQNSDETQALALKIQFADTSGITDFSQLFYGKSTFNLNISSWDTSSVENMSYMFSYASAFNQSLNNWDVSSVTNMASMFEGGSSTPTAFNQNIADWNTSSVINMSKMFKNAQYFNQDIGSWDTSNVENMGSMFYRAFVFDQNIGSWNTAKVTLMNGMFSDAREFNQDISGWNTAIVTNMSFMFYNATNFNQNISGWNVGSVSNSSSFDTNSPIDGTGNSPF